jgi:uncharacterized protein (DUF488 family)
MPDAFTFGFSNRSFEDTVRMLHAHGIERLIDIRTLPGSRHAPQYNLEILEVELPKVGIEYLHMRELGGLRKPARDSQANRGWRNASFRGYADYMQTPDFEAALERAMKLAEEMVSAFTCTEAVPWRCHRSLLADALTLRGFRISDIQSPTKTMPHRLTPFAHVEGLTLTYPAGDDQSEVS